MLNRSDINATNTHHSSTTSERATIVGGASEIVSTTTSTAVSNVENNEVTVLRNMHALSTTTATASDSSMYMLGITNILTAFDIEENK
jgi:hypothetical protein